jgi:hypothetical protein
MAVQILLAAFRSARSKPGTLDRSDRRLVTVRKGRDRPAATRAAVRPAAARAAAPPVAARPAPARATSAVPAGTTGHDRGRCFPLADAVAIALPIAFNLWMPKDWYVRYGCGRTSNAPGQMPFGFRWSSPWRHDGSLATKSRDSLSNRSRRVVAPEPTWTAFILRLCTY